MADYQGKTLIASLLLYNRGVCKEDVCVLLRSMFEDIATGYIFMLAMFVCTECIVFVMQIAWLMQVSMGTSPTESLSVAGNIFVGQVCLHIKITIKRV